MKYFGCAYYPEYWGLERLKVDIPLMKDAGINIVRIGEFAWSRMEPDEGRYELNWLHKVVEEFEKTGINVLMCTPTAAPPAWLTTKYPETLLVKADGMKMWHGSRRHYCPSSPKYREFSRKICEKLASEMSKHGNVIGWQIDNELGPESGWCHCEICQQSFRDWLKRRYDTIQNLNKAWRTGFWSVDYSDWSQIRLDDGRVELYSAQKLDCCRFRSETFIDFCREQESILRKNHPKAIVTTNGIGPLYAPVDYFKLYDTLDVACDDLYFDTATMDGNVLAMNVFRSIKCGKAYWLTETGSGALDHNKAPYPEQFRAWAWSNYAHGGDAHIVFRWRTCLSGQEQELQGILEHSGKPRHRYQAVKKTFREILSVREKIGDLPLPEAEVGMIYDHQTYWAYQSSRIGRDIDYRNLVQRLHKYFYKRQILVDLFPPDRSLSKYKLLILPSTMMISAKFAEELKNYVFDGGIVLALGHIGMRDLNNNYVENAPDNLIELFGICIEGGMYLKDHCSADKSLFNSGEANKVPVPLKAKFGKEKVLGNAHRWIADISLCGAEAVAEFKDDIYDGQPAITENKAGKGRVIYCGAVEFDEYLEDSIIDYALEYAGIEKEFKTDMYVECVKRGKYLFVINHNKFKTDLKVKDVKKVLLGELDGKRLELPAFGVALLEMRD